MALKKIKELSSGISVEYWKVTQLNINWHKKQAHMVLEGFINKEARDDNKIPVTSQIWDFSGEDFPFTIEGKNVEEGYKYITTEKILDEEDKEIGGEFCGLKEV